MNKDNKVVTNLEINIKSLKRSSRYEIDKKGPAPTLKSREQKITTSYNLVAPEKMPTLKMVMKQARKKRG